MFEITKIDKYWELRKDGWWMASFTSRDRACGRSRSVAKRLRDKTGRDTAVVYHRRKYDDIIWIFRGAAEPPAKCIQLR